MNSALAAVKEILDLDANGYALVDEEMVIAVQHLLNGNLGQIEAILSRKYGPSPAADAAVQIAEEAFRAGFEACASVALPNLKPGQQHVLGNYHDAWSEFEPSETVKDLL